MADLPSQVALARTTFHELSRQTGQLAQSLNSVKPAGVSSKSMDYLKNTSEDLNESLKKLSNPFEQSKKSVA